MGPEAKQRRRETRKSQRLEYKAAMMILRAAGKKCSNCKHYDKAPTSLKGHVCNLESDFDGYFMVTPDGLCLHHEQKTQSTRTGKS